MIVYTIQEFCDYLQSGHTEIVTYETIDTVFRILVDTSPTSFIISQARLTVGFTTAELEEWKQIFWDSL